MDSVMKGMMGQCSLQNFWARTAQTLRVDVFWNKDERINFWVTGSQHDQGPSGGIQNTTMCVLVSTVLKNYNHYVHYLMTCNLEVCRFKGD